MIESLSLLHLEPKLTLIIVTSKSKKLDGKNSIKD